jgi:hypothetical protein
MGLGIADQPFKRLSQESPMQISILTVSSHVEPQNCIDSDCFYAHTLLFVLGFREASDNAIYDTIQCKLRVHQNMVES